MLEQRKTSSRPYDGRVVNLRVDQVVLDDGTESTREVIEHRGAVAIVPMLDSDHAIFVRQYRYPVTNELLEIPAGTLEAGEEPDECARRELEEETGYSCRQIEKILEVYTAPGYSTEKIHIYLAKQLEPSSRKPDEDERIKVEPLPIQTALQKIRSGEICDAKTVCAIYRAQEILG